MSLRQHLLLVAPPTMSHSPAFDRAEALAKAMGASLHIVAFVHSEALKLLALIDSDVRQKAQEGYLRLHREWLEKEAEALREKGLDVTVEAIWVTHPLDPIFKYIRTADINLVIKDAHQESALKRIFFTPFDWQLLRDSAVPVHLVTASPHALPRKILVCIDVLHDDRQVKALNDQIIEAAMALALPCKATLYLLSIYDWSSLYLSDTGIGGVPVSVSPSYDERRKIFDAVAAKRSIPRDHRYFVAGSPIKAISDFAAKNQFDVLVMGTYSHRAFNKLLGSTAEHVLYRPPCSILAVTPSETASQAIKSP